VGLNQRADILYHRSLVIVHLYSTFDTVRKKFYLLIEYFQSTRDYWLMSQTVTKQGRLSHDE